MTPAQRAAKIVALFKLHGVDTSDWPADVQVRRVRAGRWQRSSGAWSWHLYNRQSPHLTGYGSQYSIGDLLAAKRTSLYVSPWGDAALCVESPEKK